ncbi:Saposin B-type domain-containing protein [Mycena venus]|uniref:Saposin B-type domain-containing protein n=1 Tax=Mycena venus TaxID=2733690 RepID=A0A8H6YWF0_9AGAR|nr:Saposin B-type domain-containing protein [Mycena venus]
MSANIFSFDLNVSLGALEIGIVLGVFLFGIETLQTFNYYKRFPKDSNLLKGAVGVVWLLELGHTISTLHALYLQTVTFYGQPIHILSPPLSEEIPILLSGLIYTIVQTFFANRVRVLSGQWYTMALACVLGFFRFVGDVWIAALLLIYVRVTVLLEWRWLVTTSLSLDLSTDILITASLCSCLWNMRSCESKRIRSMLDTLILWAIESTILTSASSVIQIILFMTRTDLIWAGVYVVQSKLFSNAMLASLNGRQRLRECTTANMSDIHFGSTHPSRKADAVAISFEDARSLRSLDVERK